MMLSFSSPRLGGLWKQSMVRCADNSGIIKACIIGIGRNKYGTGTVGNTIRVSVRDKIVECNAPKMPKGLIVRRKKEISRKDGSKIKFDENAFVPVSKNRMIVEARALLPEVSILVQPYFIDDKMI
ncbi:putative LSU ribosomal protein L14P [Cardiosporidium cionae]|uniref:LSU ribosomal protein L14P n=1 Tax=Cardiosporidium cionae TaxID=476202 RepID=A0ABQ7JB49_9APIC|nr:putative LSU ribosomal protein L14P [Cardiosporidium cionae]|eukprot:KAF8821237.1 putative LSU ribosomal protein L14P [Cardiosporidium cionae]